APPHPLPSSLFPYTTLFRSSAIASVLHSKTQYSSGPRCGSFACEKCTGPVTTGLAMENPNITSIRPIQPSTSTSTLRKQSSFSGRDTAVWILGLPSLQQTLFALRWSSSNREAVGELI